MAFVPAMLAVVVLAASSTSTSLAMAPQHQCGGPMAGRAWQAPGRSGTHYLVFVIGTSFGCKPARSWVAKLTGDPAKGSFGDSDTLHNGPKGYKCTGDVDNEQYAYSGFCIKGAQTNPSAGFTWSGSNG